MGSPEVAERAAFAVYLESSGPGEAAERTRRRLGAVAVRAAYDRWSGQLTDSRTIAAEVVASLGPPDAIHESTLRYSLPTRNGYLYSFDFSGPRGMLRWSGFVRVAVVEAPAGLRNYPGAIAPRLAEIGATVDEVMAWLGAPARRDGWWPIETWEYADGVVLQFRHGVVEQAH